MPFRPGFAKSLWRLPAATGMAPGPEKVDVRRAQDDKAQAEKLRMLKELAKATKPIADSKGMKGVKDE
jgi:hypothetical protein